MPITTALGLIKYHEGCVLVAKPDAKGKWEIGWGDDIPAPADPSNPPTCTQDEADERLGVNFALACYNAVSDVGRGAWGLLNAARQAVLIDMAYELGGKGLSEFKNMMKALAAGDFAEASRQMLDSDLAEQVPNRAHMNATILLTGRWPQV